MRHIDYGLNSYSRKNIEEKLTVVVNNDSWKIYKMGGNDG